MDCLGNHENKWFSIKKKLNWFKKVHKTIFKTFYRERGEGIHVKLWTLINLWNRGDIGTRDGACQLFNCLDIIWSVKMSVYFVILKVNSRKRENLRQKFCHVFLKKKAVSLSETLSIHNFLIV